jgi:hypothetical protein
MLALLAVVLCLATGLSLVEFLWPARLTAIEDRVLKYSLAAPCGLAVFSIVYFLWVVTAQSRTLLMTLDLAIPLVFFALLRRRSQNPTRLLPAGRTNTQQSATWLSKSLGTGFVLAAAAALYSCIRWAIAEPHGGGWDAVAIWNLHARFLFLGGPHWTDGFSTLIPFSHPDYPLLLPASVAHFWTYLQRDAEFVPATIGIVFTVSIVALLYSAVCILRTKTQALIAALVLVSTPSFLKVGVSQFADIPLAFYILASIVLLAVSDLRETGSRRLLFLAGAMAALAAWTKNEGLLFFCALVALRLGQVLWGKDARSLRREFVPILLGAAPILLVIAYFKLFIAPPGDLFSSPQMLDKVTDLSRYWLIVRWFGKELFFFSGWKRVPLTIGLAIYAKLLGSEISRHYRSSVSLSTLLLAFTLAGYFAVYVITPYDLRWHLRFSLDRLFLQLWPSALFLFFVAVRTPEQWMARISAEPRIQGAVAIPSTLDEAA